MAHFKNRQTVRNIILILFGFIFLILWSIVGYPFEIGNLKADRLLTILISVLIAGFIFVIFRLVTKIKSKIIKIVFLISLIGISLIYSLNGLLTYFISYDKGPVWEDRQIYINQKGQKVISQFRETSGSIYDYRERLIFYEFSNGNKISIDWTKDRMHGIWKVKDLKKDSLYIENFDKK